jgi:probable dihydroxyacetone kinase regulator
MSKITKKALAISLKKILSQKTLDKVTIKEIVDDCGITRQAFYYHFQDLYDLLELTFMSEITENVEGNLTFDTWKQCFFKLCEYFKTNKDFINNIYNSIDYRGFEGHIYKLAYELLFKVVEEQTKGLHVSIEDKKNIINLYKYIFVGFIIEWINNGMKESSDDMVNKLDMLISGVMKNILEKYDS